MDGSTGFGDNGAGTVDIAPGIQISAVFDRDGTAALHVDPAVRPCGRTVPAGKLTLRGKL